jgi:hypothetical protein
MYYFHHKDTNIHQESSAMKLSSSIKQIFGAAKDKLNSGSIKLKKELIIIKKQN